MTCNSQWKCFKMLLTWSTRAWEEKTAFCKIYFWDRSQSGKLADVNNVGFDYLHRPFKPPPKNCLWHFLVSTLIISLYVCFFSLCMLLIPLYFYVSCLYVCLHISFYVCFIYLSLCSLPPSQSVFIALIPYHTLCYETAKAPILENTET